MRMDECDKRKIESPEKLSEIHKNYIRKLMASSLFYISNRIAFKWTEVLKLR